MDDLRSAGETMTHSCLGAALATAIAISAPRLIQKGVCGEVRAGNASQIASAGLVQPDWSAPVDGVRGRLIVTPSDAGQFKLELELQNVGAGAGPKEIWWDSTTSNLNLLLVDETGKQLTRVRPVSIPSTGMRGGPFWLPLLRQSSVRVTVANNPYGKDADGRTWLFLLLSHEWTIAKGPGGPTRLFIDGIFRPDKEPEARYQMWRGSLNLPRVEIPVPKDAMSLK